MQLDDFLQKRIRELSSISSQRDVVVFSDFLTVSEQDEALAALGKKGAAKAAFFGGFEGAERLVLAFFPQWMEEDQIEYPIACLQVAPKSQKFAQKTLSHRDYLGAVLHLGVERAMIGDILVAEAGAYLFCKEQIADFLQDQLQSVSHTPVVVSRVTEPSLLPKPGTETVSGTVASVRLDTLLALGFQKSRSSLSGVIEGGLVYVNGRQVLSNSYSPKEGDIISLRGTGRFLFAEEVGNTKKGRVSVRLERYI